MISRALPLGLLGFLVLGCLALSGCNNASGGAQEAEAEKVVLVQKAHFLPQDEARSFVASIRARIETDLAFRVGGKVLVRLVDMGQRVKSGQILARLDEADLILQKQQADAELAASKTALEQAGTEEKRGTDLLKKGWMAQSAYDRLRAAADEARGRNLRARRAVDLAANALDYAVLRADADGIIAATSVEPGQVVAAGQPVLRLARLAEKEAVVALPENFVARVKDCDAGFSLWSAPRKKSYQAVLRELSPAADPVTRTFTARFSLPEADDSIALGMSGTLTLTPGHSPLVARLPLSALFDQGKGASLFVVDASGRLSLRPVEARGYDESSVLVASGIAEGDDVVILGVQKLEAGEKVRPTTQIAF